MTGGARSQRRHAGPQREHADPPLVFPRLVHVPAQVDLAQAKAGAQAAGAGRALQPA